MREASLTLTKAIILFRATEISKDQIKTLGNETKIDGLRANLLSTQLRVKNNSNLQKMWIYT